MKLIFLMACIIAASSGAVVSAAPEAGFVPTNSGRMFYFRNDLAAGIVTISRGVSPRPGEAPFDQGSALNYDEMAARWLAEHGHVCAVDSVDLVPHALAQVHYRCP